MRRKALSRKRVGDDDFKGKERERKRREEMKRRMRHRPSSREELADLSCASETPTIIIHMFKLN